MEPVDKADDDYQRSGLKITPVSEDQGHERREPQRVKAAEEEKTEPSIAGSQFLNSRNEREHHPQQQQDEYTLFTRRQKSWIIFLAALAGWFSTASSFIYFPAIPFLADDMGISIEQVNLSVTLYLVASAVFPTITGYSADKYGRRIAFMVSLGFYSVVNVGLALQRNLAALFVLRMAQSASISGTFAIAYGVIGDLTTPADRGGYTGIISVFLTTPPSVAPLVSGLLLIRWTWPSIFWFLTIASAVVFAAIALLMPETCRSIVSNGLQSRSLGRPVRAPPSLSLCPPSGSGPNHNIDETNRNPLKEATSRLGPSVRNEKDITTAGAGRRDENADKSQRNAGGLQSPIATLALLRDPGTFTACLLFGVYYATWSCLQASLSTVFVDVYQVSGLVAGLSYIPFGVACSISSFIAGSIIDRDYRHTASRHDPNTLPLSPSPAGQGTDHQAVLFPIEFARFRTTKYSILVCTPVIAAYGWSLQVKAHIAVPLILQFLIGFTNQPLFTSLNTILVDLNPTQPSSVQAACNGIRCVLAAALLAAVDPMLRRMGPGWTFVVFAGIHVATFPIILWVFVRFGPRWRARKCCEG